MFQYGMRPILMAAWHGHTDAVQMLINYGASVNTINKVIFNNSNDDDDDSNNKNNNNDNVNNNRVSTAKCLRV